MVAVGRLGQNGMSLQWWDEPHCSPCPAAQARLQGTQRLTALCPCSWVSVLSNSKGEALNVAFSKVQGGGECSQEELTQAIIQEVTGMPGNRECCDCSAPGESQPMAVGLPCFLLLDKQSSALLMASSSWTPAATWCLALPSVLLWGLCPGVVETDGEERQEKSTSLAVLSLQIPLGSSLTWAS